MNKALVFAAIAVVAISKVFVLKSVLVDLSAYQRCVSDGSVSLAKSCDRPICLFHSWLVGYSGWLYLARIWTQNAGYHKHFKMISIVA
jgi:hypothetical protein